MARVVSCRYMRISCSEDDHPLFRRYYASLHEDPLWPMNLANGEAMDEKNEHRLQPEKSLTAGDAPVHGHPEGDAARLDSRRQRRRVEADLQGTRSQPGTLTWLYSLTMNHQGFHSFLTDDLAIMAAALDVICLPSTWPPVPSLQLLISIRLVFFPRRREEMEIDSVGWASAEPSTRTNEEIHANTYRFQQGQEEKQQKQLAAINCGFREKGQHLLILWRFLQSHSLRDLKFTEAASTQLQERFLLLISDVYDALGGVLHEVLAESGSFTRGNQHASIPTLVDEVLSLVYIQPRFRHLRVGFVALLMDQRPAGSLSDTLNCAFQAFTALTREGMIASVTRYRNSRRLGVNDLIWNQRWLLGPGSVQLLNYYRFPKDDRHEMRLVDAMQLISEFGCLDFTVEDDASGLSVRSAVSMSASACITLVLDGKLRVFRVLPSGISSMIATTGGWSIGDYTAAFAEDGRSLEVNLFSFAESTSNGFTIGDAQSINLRRSASDGIVKLRRVSLLIRLEQEFNIEVTGSTVQRDLFAFVTEPCTDQRYRYR
ncbi:hypothetical protein GQ600_14784 [Phytophthora cactorum]|nr:hypothetical protein GQ600_14784 [Phytophthora cactorum]